MGGRVEGAWGIGIVRGVELGAGVEWVWMGKLGLALVVQIGLGQGGCEWRDLRLGLTVLSRSATGGTRLFLVCMALVYVSREEITGGWGSKGGGRGTSNVSGSAIGEGMGNPELWRGIQTSHPIRCVSATDGVPGTARRRRGGGLLYRVY